MAEFPTGLKDIDRADWLPEMGYAIIENIYHNFADIY